MRSPTKFQFLSGAFIGKNHTLLNTAHLIFRILTYMPFASEGLAREIRANPVGLPLKFRQDFPKRDVSQAEIANEFRPTEAFKKGTNRRVWWTEYFHRML